MSWAIRRMVAGDLDAVLTLEQKIPEAPLQNRQVLTMRNPMSPTSAIQTMATQLIEIGTPRKK